MFKYFLVKQVCSFVQIILSIELFYYDVWVFVKDVLRVGIYFLYLGKVRCEEKLVVFIVLKCQDVL